MSTLHRTQGTPGVPPAGIAVIGLAGRFPGATDPEGLWRNLCAGVESVRDLSDQELQELCREAGVDPRRLDDPTLVKRRGCLDDLDRFDAPFFGINPREAELMDPQHRLFLEVAVEALDSAGHPDETAGAIGVFAGTSMSGYLLHNVFPHLAGRGFDTPWPMVLGNDKDHLATRVSYLLGLTGPSLLVQTACSTGLVAVHMARRALLAGECDLAIAGAASIRIPQNLPHPFHEGGINSPDGRCRPFDAAAQGTVGGNGVGAVVLRRLDEALADGDTIHAVLRGSALNNDGNRKVGYTAPSVEGQTRAIRAALDEAGVDPATIGFVEAHGTGTALGDPIEVEALHRAFSGGDAPLPPVSCALGSIKGNLGHLDTAAGIAGLIKAVLAVEAGLVPPTVHFEHPSPRIPWAAGPFFVPRELTSWPDKPGPRRAGVSSFGLGGTNVHAVLEQAPARETPEKAPEETPGETYALVLSAKTASALELAGERLAAHLRRHPELSLADVEHTLAVGRRSHGYRRAIFAGDREQALDALEGRDPARVRSAIVARGSAGPRGLPTGSVSESAAAATRDAAVEGWLRGELPVGSWSRAGSRRVPLPPTVFDDHRFWVRADGRALARQAPRVSAPETWRRETWRRETGAPSPGPARRWLLVAPAGTDSELLAAELRRRGLDVDLAPAGGSAAELGRRLASWTADGEGGEGIEGGVVLWGTGWGPTAAGADEVGTVVEHHAGPWWWLTRGREAVLAEVAPLSEAELAALAAAGAPREGGPGRHTLDLPADAELADARWCERLAAELTARHPLPRAALCGRFRWSASPIVSASPRPAPGRDPALFDRPYEAPRNAKERRLARIFQELLGVEAIGVHDDFFALGGHSLLMVQLAALVQEMSGVAIPLSRIQSEPTIAALAQAVAELQPSAILAIENPAAAAAAEVLVGLQPEGDRPALFLVHPGGGHLLNYRELARELAPDQPLYGLEAPGVGDSQIEPLESVEAMAERYLASIRRHQPRGPYHLAGYCVGGLVAYEMARRLRREGETVGCLAMLDTVAEERHRSADPRWLDGVATHFFASDLGVRVGAEELEAEAPERWGDLVWAKFRERAPEAARRLGEETYRRLYRVFLAIRRASWAYAPEPYEGALSLFLPRISSRDEALETSLLGWRELALGGVEEHRVPGSHTTMLSSPQVQVLAQRLRSSLERAEGRAEPLATGLRSPTT